MPNKGISSLFQFIKAKPYENDFTRYLYAVSQFLVESGARDEVAAAWSQLTNVLGFPLSGGGLKFRLQVRTELGQPDLQIVDDQSQINMEVKVDAVADPDQVARYGEVLAGVLKPNKGVLLLTKTGDELRGTSFSFPFAELSWQQVTEAFEGLQKQLHDGQSFVVGELVAFLKENNVSFERVDSEWDPAEAAQIPASLKTAYRWAELLRVAAGNLGLEADGDADWDSIFEGPEEWASYGYYLDGRRYWVGVILSRGPFVEFLNGAGEALGYADISDLIAIAKREFTNVKIEEDVAVDVPISPPEPFYSLTHTEQISAVQSEIDSVLQTLRKHARQPR